jgi:hypothetical protein
MSAVMLRWEEPPEATHSEPVRASEWEPIAEQLRQQAYRWALIATGTKHTGTAGAINTGRIRCFPAGSFEARRRLVDGEIRIYARYVGVGVPSSCAA